MSEPCSSKCVANEWQHARHAAQGSHPGDACLQDGVVDRGSVGSVGTAIASSISLVHVDLSCPALVVTPRLPSQPRDQTGENVSRCAGAVSKAPPGWTAAHEPILVGPAQHPLPPP